MYSARLVYRSEVKCIQCVGGRTEGKRLLERPIRGWANNIKKLLKEVR
jgi:hypothetical protein